MAKITGLEQLRANIQRINKQLESELPRIVEEGAEIILKEVHDKAPVKTGALQNAFEIDSSNTNTRATSVIQLKNGETNTYVNSSANRRLGRAGKEYKTDGPEYYWKFIEFGTSKMPGRPFIRPAFEVSKERARQHMIDRVLKVVKQ